MHISVCNKIYSKHFQLHQSSGGNLTQQTAILTSQTLHDHDIQTRNVSVASSTNPSMTIVSSNPNTLQSATGAQIPSSPSKPSILRRRDPLEPLGKLLFSIFCTVLIHLFKLHKPSCYIMCILINLGSSLSPSRAIHNTNSSLTDQFGPGADRGPDSDGSSSGSTTLSATSSPGGAGNGIGSRIGDGNLSGKAWNYIIFRSIV